MPIEPGALTLLFIALLLPWLGGYFWLGLLARRFSKNSVHSCSQLGYGLFVGYAGLQGVVLAYNAVTGGVYFVPILVLVLIVTALGGLLYLRSPRFVSALPERAPPANSMPVETALLCLLVGWTALHLAVVCIEILHRPVFPWDAWLSWIYRAKAWFFAGEILVMDHPVTWIRGTGSSLYNVAGQFYPTFSPILALWSALALGQWSETLINLPVLLCGIALALAMFGQARDQGLPVWASALAAYLLLSLPLIGAHLALAGQADIWMAGFTGLGFVALLRGLTQHCGFQLALGLGMVAMGIATKSEGAVWFLSALLTTALVLRPRLSLLAIAAFAILAVAGWMVGITYLDIPLLGGLGLNNGRLHIPLLGSYGLQDFDLLDDYWENFVNSGTWHLLWTLLSLAAGAAIVIARGRLRHTLLVFFGVSLAAQMLIFEGTAIGKWAEDWTAINRLPLHFAPPLLFAIMLLVGDWRLPGGWRAAGKTLLVPAITLILTSVLAMGYLSWAYPSSKQPAVELPAGKFQARVGGGQIKDGVGLISRFDNNVAIFSNNTLSLAADSLPLLTLETAGENEKRITLFWRRQQNPGEPSKTTVWGRGTRYINLADEPDWNGTITEIGLVFYNDQGKSLEFRGLSLAPYSMGSQLRKLANDWQVQTFWSQRSVHWLPAGAIGSTLPLPTFMGAWLLLTCLALIVTGRKPSWAAGSSVILCALVAWLVLDARWTANRLAQVELTLRDYPLFTARQQIFGDDLETASVVAKATESLDSPRQRLQIMAEDKTMRFQMLRAKYHALPVPTHVHEGTAGNLPKGVADKVLVLRSLYIDPSEQPADSNQWASEIGKRMGGEARVEWDTPQGFLLSVTVPNNTHGS